MKFDHLVYSGGEYRGSFLFLSVNPFCSQVKSEEGRNTHVQLKMCATAITYSGVSVASLYQRMKVS